MHVTRGNMNITYSDVTHRNVIYGNVAHENVSSLCTFIYVELMCIAYILIHIMAAQIERGPSRTISLHSFLEKKLPEPIPEDVGASICKMFRIGGYAPLRHSILFVGLSTTS